MSKSTAKSTAPLTSAEVRTLARSGKVDVTKVLDAKGQPIPTGWLTGGPQGTGRGRVHPLAVKAAEKATGRTFAEKVAPPERTMEVPMFSAKTGRAVKPVSRPISEVRSLAGIPGSKGRVPADALHRAALALGSGEPKAPKAAPAAKSAKVATTKV